MGDIKLVRVFHGVDGPEPVFPGLLGDCEDVHEAVMGAVVYPEVPKRGDVGWVELGGENSGSELLKKNLLKSGKQARGMRRRRRRGKQGGDEANGEPSAAISARKVCEMWIALGNSHSYQSFRWRLC